MKRLYDVTVAALLLALSFPLFLMIVFAVRREDGGPALFRQQRIGRDQLPFEILKFRTMRAAAGAPITKAGDPRITRTGAFLRRWKLDELPQLWNVIRGDMSLVGPRPEVPEYVRLYPDAAKEIFRVRPGITGPAQLRGIREEDVLAASDDPERTYREVLLPRKIRIDLGYARRAGFCTDLVLLARTGLRVLARDAARPRTVEHP